MADSHGDVRDDAWRRLVPAAQRGDRTARAGLYEAFAPVVHAIVLGQVGPDHAEDVTQDVFCSVFRSLARLREPEAFPGFVCSAARNAGRDHLRRRRRAPTTEPLPPDAASPRGGPAAAASAREQTERVFGAIQELPEAYREPLLLRLVAQLSGTEIAARTGLTHGSVRVNLARGMAMLRERLAGPTAEVMP